MQEPLPGLQRPLPALRARPELPPVRRRPGVRGDRAVEHPEEKDEVGEVLEDVVARLLDPVEDVEPEDEAVVDGLGPALPSRDPCKWVLSPRPWGPQIGAPRRARRSTG